MDGKEIRSGTHILATHRYKKNPDSPVGNEQDLNQGNTLVYSMQHDENELRSLEEDGNGQVGYVPVAYHINIIDKTIQEEEDQSIRTLKEE